MSPKSSMMYIAGELLVSPVDVTVAPAEFSIRRYYDGTRLPVSGLSGHNL